MFAYLLEYEEHGIDDEENDRILKQSQWTTLDGLSTIWDSIGIDSPDQNWIQQYHEDYANHQEINLELAKELTDAYNKRQ